MRIVKDLKDYKLTKEQQVFAGFIKDKMVDSGCSEGILNPDFIAEYLRPANDFVVYTNAQPGAEAIRLIRR